MPSSAGSRTVALALLLAPLLASLALADERESLSGDWGGARARLGSRGVTFEGAWTSDAMGVVRGGLERRRVALADLALGVAIDGAALCGRERWSVRVATLAHRGGSPSASAGDAQCLDNIDYPESWKLHEAWVEFGGAGGSLRAGVYDLNSEFDAADVPSLFLNGSHGMGIDLGQSGWNGPSVYPNTALAVRGAWRTAAGLEARAAVLDGVPGDPDDPRRTDLRWRREDGALAIAEFTVRRRAADDDGVPGPRVSLGGWRYTGAFLDVRDLEASGAWPWRRDNAGVYLLAEHRLRAERGDAAQGLAGWLRAGVARAEVNPFERYTGLGLVYTGLLPRRDADALGVAMAVAHASRGWFDARLASGFAMATDETALELTYRAVLTPWLAVQPDVQYVVHPGVDPLVPDVLAVGLRIDLTL